MSMATCLRRSFLGLAAAGLCGTALAEPPNTALSVGFDAEGNFRYTQDFNSLAPQGSSQRWVDGVTLRGWQLRNFVEQSLVTPSLKLDHGLSSSGSFYSYGLPGDNNRALGVLGSGGFYFGSPVPGSTAGHMILLLRNDSGRDIERITLGFTGQQWRQGASTLSNTLVMEYGVGDRFGTVPAWLRSGLDFVSPLPEAYNANGSPLVGNEPRASQRLSGSWAVSWPAGSLLWLRWTGLNNESFDHGLAIDDLELTLKAPTP